MATERLDLSGYDLIISSDAATMKGVRPAPDATHICYCHTPMRYVWEGFDTYYRFGGPLTRLALPLLRDSLRNWDSRAAQCVTHFVANSRNVADRIRRCYDRESTVIYPPVDTEYFSPRSSGRMHESYFLVVSQLVPYKRVDLVVEAFNQCGRPLVVVGEGPGRRKIERRANSNVRFLGYQPDEVVLKAMQSCRALVFPGEEDLGIVMAEAHACGTPVVAFARGGASEIVTDGVTGILFEEQSVESLLKGLSRFECSQFDPDTIRASALRFTREKFARDISSLVRHATGSRRSHSGRAPNFSRPDGVVAKGVSQGRDSEDQKPIPSREIASRA
jgi:glycosyltransferase involved in cell wall biosynthesis